MAGRIDETHYAKLKERKLSDQSELEEFSEDETTYIAVVSEPRGKMEEITDEVARDLGMPKWALYNFMERRAGYRTNSAVDDPHNKAWRDVGLGAIYHSHIKESEQAKGQIRDLAERVISGEDITLVCYEEPGKNCHRHILVDRIRERVQSREDCKFELRV